MTWLTLLHESWLSISAHRLRTFLAVLGIVIGVASVILMLAVGSGSRKAVEESINKLGTNVLMVYPGNYTHKGAVEIDPLNLLPEYADFISGLPSVVSAAPSTWPASMQIIAGKNNWNSRVMGTTSAYFPIRNWIFSEGGNFTDDDMKLSKRVAILGATVASKLFPGEVAVGHTIRINTISFQVIGVLEHKGNDFSGRDQDDTVYVPVSTVKTKLFGRNDLISSMINYIFVQVASKEAMEQAAQEITDLLRQLHRLRPTQENDFTIRNMSSVAEVASETTQALSLLLGTVASISLIVGGIGIMNIMLVTVTERTREIGIRKAIGASERDILLQFLLEAVLIATFGSIAGLVIGFGLGVAANEWMNIATAYSLWPALLAIVVAGVVGVLSGIYPAWKAAKLEPIEALRAVGA